MKLCDYGCGQGATHQFKNGKWCCSLRPSQCPYIIKKISKNGKGLTRNKNTRNKISNSLKGHYVSNETKEKISESNKNRSIPKKLRKKMGIAARLSIKRIKQKYKIFSKEEEIRYNPDKAGQKEIQVHCKNHNCHNSKEQGGWFTPTKSQLSERIRQLEHDSGNDGSYFYCSNDCKDQCPLYRFRYDLETSSIEKFSTDSEYKIFRDHVLNRDNYKCQYCGKKAEHVHHERPQKLEPFFSLDPDLAWSVCKSCHGSYAHKDYCNYYKLASKKCSENYSRID